MSEELGMSAFLRKEDRQKYYEKPQQKYEPMNTGIAKVEMTLGDILRTALDDPKKSVGYWYKGKRYGSYEEASAEYGNNLVKKMGLKPLRLGVFPFAKAKQLGVPVKSLPEWSEYEFKAV